MLNDLNMQIISYIFNNMDDAVFVTGKKGTIRYANPAAERMLNLPGDYKSSVKIHEAIRLTEENDDLITLFLDALQTGENQSGTAVTFLDNRGELHRLLVRVNYVEMDDGFFIAVLSDITELTRVTSAFTRYTSTQIADYVLNKPEGEKQGGVPRYATILMSDLRGFSSLCESMDADSLVTMLNHYFEIMVGIIERQHGTVIEFLGDGIFVVFGAPQDMADHASAAACCAVEMQNAMAGVNAWSRENGYPELEMGIGVNSGPAVVGNIGSDQKMKYGCMGETVNLAGRLETFSLGGEICISEQTRNLIPADVKAITENAFMPKGGREEIRYCTIAGVGDCVLKNAAGEIRWRRLREAKDTVYYLLDGKTVGPKPYSGKLSEVSENGRYGILVTDSMLDPLQNLMLRFGDMEVYAKVTRKAERGIQIGFTAKPEVFAELIG